MTATINKLPINCRCHMELRSREINGYRTTGSRHLMDEKRLRNHQSAPVGSSLRAVCPRLFRAGADWWIQGCVKPINSPTIYRLSPKRGHNTATHALQAVHASNALEPSSLPAFQAPHALHDSAPEARVTSLQDAALMALEHGINENCMWNFARALKGFQQTTKSLPELGSALAVWWAAAELPKSASFDEYLCDLTDCWGRVKTALGANALHIAEQTLPPLPEAPTFDDRMERLKRLCAALQKHAGSGSFFIGLRDIGRITGNADPYAAKKMIAFLISKGLLKCVEKGTAAGRKASRYTFKP